MFKNIYKCRVCKNTNLVSIMNLGNQFLTGKFPKFKNEKVTSGPVELVKCFGDQCCGLVQLKQSYDLSEMYGMNYGYRSGLNKHMVNHLQSKVKKILSSDVLKNGDVIIDIGSNDATTLLAYPKNLYRLIGVDPTGEKFLNYYPEDIKLITDFFSCQLIKKELGNKKAKVITSFSMFYDLEDPIKFAQDIEQVLDDSGIWVFEQSYLPSMLKANSFDTICHEHLEFYSLKQIKWILDRANIKIIDVEFNDINGGSFSIISTKKNSFIESQTIKIENILEEEVQMGLDKINIYDNFKFNVEKNGNLLKLFLLEVKKKGKRVCGIGASTKGNVLLQYFGINNHLIESIGEVNEDKYGSFTPGTLIPLLPEEEILLSNPDYLIILPWHFKNFFLKHPKFKGRKMIFPLPHFEVIELPS
jgi:hypothetical protein